MLHLQINKGFGSNCFFKDQSIFGFQDNKCILTFLTWQKLPTKHQLQQYNTMISNHMQYENRPLYSKYLIWKRNIVKTNIQYVCSHLSKQRKPLTSFFNSQLQVVVPAWLWNYSKKVITWFCKVELRVLIESKHSMPWANNLLVHTLPRVKSFNKSVCELVEG